MRSTTSILILSLLVPVVVLGDAQFTSPAATGSSFVGGTQFVVSWADAAANLPSIASAVGDWTLSLCTGGDTDATMVGNYSHLVCWRVFMNISGLMWSCRTVHCRAK